LLEWLNLFYIKVQELKSAAEENMNLWKDSISYRIEMEAKLSEIVHEKIGIENKEIIEKIDEYRMVL
jgi:hypothetical protein